MAATVRWYHRCVLFVSGLKPVNRVKGLYPKVGTTAARIAECQGRHYLAGGHASRSCLASEHERVYQAAGRSAAALESQHSGRGDDRLLCEMTGLDEATIRWGQEELQAECSVTRVRQPGA